MADRLTKRTKSGCPDIEFSRFPNPRDLMSGYADIYIKLCDMEDAEEQRNKGCEYCNDCNNQSWHKFKRFELCPHCGRKLSEVTP